MNFRNYSSSWHYYANESNKIALLTYSSILLVRLNICLFLMLEIFPTNILSLSKIIKKKTIATTGRHGPGIFYWRSIIAIFQVFFLIFFRSILNEYKSDFSKRNQKTIRSPLLDKKLETLQFSLDITNNEKFEKHERDEYDRNS